jgi:hypothetical protein
MPEAKPKPCSYFLVRYVPNLLRDEGLNIGVLLHCPEERYLGCLFAEDFRWIRRLDRKADLALLGALQQDFEKQIESNEGDEENYLKSLCQSLSNAIQLEGPRACLLTDPQVEIETLYEHSIGVRPAKDRPRDTRLRIKQQLTAALVRGHVWERLERRIPAEHWTQPGDPFAFDYGYKPNGSVRLIHAVSLKRDTQLSKTLAYTLDCVREAEPAILTAVVEALPEAGDTVAAASQNILLEADVRLQPIGTINAFVEAIRKELQA